VSVELAAVEDEVLSEGVAWVSPDAGLEAAAGESGGEDSVCELAQLDVAALRLLERLQDERLRLCVFCSQRSLGEFQGDDGVDQPLLCTVVEVAHDAATGIICLGEQTRPRSGELVTAVGVGDRGVE